MADILPRPGSGGGKSRLSNRVSNTEMRRAYPPELSKSRQSSIIRQGGGKTPCGRNSNPSANPKRRLRGKTQQGGAMKLADQEKESKGRMSMGIKLLPRWKAAVRIISIPGLPRPATCKKGAGEGPIHHRPSINIPKQLPRGLSGLTTPHSKDRAARGGPSHMRRFHRCPKRGDWETPRSTKIPNRSRWARGSAGDWLDGRRKPCAKSKENISKLNP